MIEVKYREHYKILESDLIVEKVNIIPNLVVTKNVDDFGLKDYGDGKKIYKIPAPVFFIFIRLC